MTYTDERQLLGRLPRPFIRRPGESRDPRFSRLGRGQVGPGFCRDDGLDLLWVLPK
jgi:hypothetical protein